MKEIETSKVFGNKVAHVFTIEFQKRGLPHMHALLFLKSPNKIRTCAQVDKLVCAEFQTQKIILCFLKLSNVVWYMVHVVLEIRKHHVWKMVDALRDTLELSQK